MSKLVTFAILFGAATAMGAAPAYVPVQGYLTDSAGAALEGSHDITLTLYDADVGGSTLFSEQQTVLVEGGLAVIYLGSESTLDLGLFRDHGTVYLGIQIGTDAEMTPRLPIGSAPFAAYAQYADTAMNVVGGTVDATSVAVDGTPVIDAAGAWVGAAPTDTLGALSCADGQVPQQTSTGWDCANVGTDTLAGLGCTTDGELAKWNGMAWACAPDDDTDTDTLAGLTCNVGDVPKYDGGGGWDCLPDAVVTSVDGLAGGNIASHVTVSGDVSVWRDNKALVMRQDGTNSYLSNKANFVSNGADPNGTLYLNGSGGVELRYGDNGASGDAGLRLDGAGRVGIGTTSPTSTLDVNGTVTWSRAGSNVDARLIGWSAGSAYDMLLPIGTSTAGAAIEGPQDFHLTIGLRGNDPGDTFSVCTDSDFDGTVDRLGLVVNAAGNVGVATASPQVFAAEPRVLDVAGSVKSRYGMAVVRDDTWGTYRVIDTSNSRQWLMGMQGDQGFEVRHFDGTAWNRLMRFEPTDPDVATTYDIEGPNVIGGFQGNAVASSTVSDPVYGATIAGGGVTSHANTVTRALGTVAGGAGNTAGESAFVGGGFYNVANGHNGVISGGESNSVTSFYGTIAGGRENTAANYASVGGGWDNSATGPAATISGGSQNDAGDNATIGGGYQNGAGGTYTTVAGGWSNSASGYGATIAGGEDNAASGDYTAVVGGRNNTAAGDYSFAAGRRAKANHIGSFVWGDSWDADYASSASNRFQARAQGGVYFHTNAALDAGVYVNGGGGSWNTVSDENKKEHFEPVDGRAVLDKVAAIPISTWNYKSQDDSIRHMGPMAQDFGPAFGLGDGELTINTVDADGVALAAIQGLNAKLEEENAKLHARIDRLESRLETGVAESSSSEWYAVAGLSIGALALFVRRRR